MNRGNRFSVKCSRLQRVVEAPAGLLSEAVCSRPPPDESGRWSGRDAQIRFAATPKATPKPNRDARRVAMVTGRGWATFDHEWRNGDHNQDDGVVARGGGRMGWCRGRGVVGVLWPGYAQAYICTDNICI